MFALCEGDQIPRSVNRSILPTDEILHAQILHNQSRGRRCRRARHGSARPEPSRAESRAARAEARKPSQPFHPDQNLFEGEPSETRNGCSL